MSHGPITIFDKSAFEALNIDDAALFGVFYRIALTTLFFVETLADLEKEVLRGRTDATADTREPYLMSTGQPVYKHEATRSGGVASWGHAAHCPRWERGPYHQSDRTTFNKGKLSTLWL